MTSAAGLTGSTRPSDDGVGIDDVLTLCNKCLYIGGRLLHKSKKEAAAPRYSSMSATSPANDAIGSPSTRYSVCG